MDAHKSHLLSRLDRFGRYSENVMLCLLLGMMIFLGAMQIVQRNFFSTSFSWTDELLRLLVLWLGLVGAVAASRDDRHISIDILSRYLAEKRIDQVRLVVDFFTASVCATLAWHSTRFVLLEKEYGATIMTGQPAWIFEAVIPVVFVLIAYRYAIFFLQRIRNLWTMRGQT